MENGSPISQQVYDIGGLYPTLPLPGGIEFPTYFIITSLACVAAIAFLAKRADQMSLSRNRALDVGLVTMISGFVGSRLFHVFFEEPHYYWIRPSRVFEFWKGGFVWYGGAIAGAIGMLAYLKLKREPLRKWLDLFAPVASLGYALGRVACLFAGCCYGRVFIIPGMLRGYSIRHPTQAYAIIWETGVLLFLLRCERIRRSAKPSNWLCQPGQIFFIWLVGHSLGRIVMEHFRADPRGPEPLGFSLATWISLALALAASWQIHRGRTKSVR